MSASLVGSEMCIRDRPRVMQIWAPEALAPASEKRGPDVLQTPSRREDPVSYTHLTLPTICSV
eukprot:12335364-Alexandrium_andersonii.AAC.1